MYYYCANQVAYNTTQPGGVGYSSGDQPSCTGKLSELRCTLTTTTAGELMQLSNLTLYIIRSIYRSLEAARRS